MEILVATVFNADCRECLATLYDIFLTVLLIDEIVEASMFSGSEILLHWPYKVLT